MYRPISTMIVKHRDVLLGMFAFALAATALIWPIGRRWRRQRSLRSVIASSTDKPRQIPQQQEPRRSRKGEISFAEMEIEPSLIKSQHDQSSPALWSRPSDSQFYFESLSKGR